MYAIVDVKDKQFKVRENDTLYVPYHADAEIDETLTLDRVMLLSNGEGEATIGTPTVDGASVTARVVDHVKGDKVIVFKKKRRKRYRVKKGHRQQYTQIRIESLNADGAAPPPADDDASDAAETTDSGTTDVEAADAEPADTDAAEAEASDEASTETEEDEVTEASGEASDADDEETTETEESEDAETADEESEDEESEDKTKDSE